MDTETRAALAQLSHQMTAGFDRMERYFELQQAQFVEFRSTVNTRFDILTERLDVLTERVDILTERMDALTDRVSGLEAQFRSFRDWATGEIAEIRIDLRETRRLQTEAMNHHATDIERLAMRVDRLEDRVNGLTE